MDLCTAQYLNSKPSQLVTSTCRVCHKVIFNTKKIHTVTDLKLDAQYFMEYHRRYQLKLNLFQCHLLTDLHLYSRGLGGNADWKLLHIYPI